jgi:very-short-patch-repair endonuclease
MFSEHPKAKYWSNKNLIKPHEVALNSHKKFWFDCGECGHDFESSLLNINQSNNWCPYCYNRKLCGNCDKCYEKSFASHPKALYWSNENELKPNEVLKGADRKKYKFNCDKCPHTFEIVLKSITTKNQWCSYCSHQKLCDDNNCNMCFNNSFSSIERSKYLYDKTINPRTLFKSTNKKYKFDCNNCNKTFSCQLSDITKGVWCSFCVNKTEKILFDKLVEVYNNLKQQYKVDWCKDKRYLPYDFVIENKKIIIELDGKQHFEQIGNWQSPEKTRENDIYKIKRANENGFSIIRILQKDVYYNKYDWLEELIQNIEKITNEERVQNIYMCKNNEYKDFDIILNLS